MTAPPATSPPGPAAQVWPPDRFLWAIVDPPASTPAARSTSWQRTGVMPPGLLPDLAEQLPIPTDDLHPVCTPTTDGRLIVCAAAAADLLALPPATRSLAPASLPPGIDGLADPASLNLLVGPFEPAPIRRARTRRHLAAMLTLLAAAALIAFGAFRREQHAASLTHHARQATSDAIKQVLPASADPAALAAELDRARRTAAVDLSRRRSPDAAAALAALLEAWPAATAAPALPQSIAVGPDGITLSVLVPGDPAVFLRAFNAPHGWRLDEPRLVAVDNRTRIAIRLGRAQAAHAGAPVP